MLKAPDGSWMKQLAKDYKGHPSPPPFQHYPGVSFVGIVPVRKGSKGCQGKNLRMLGHKPLYRWVADAAKTAGVFDRILILSDWKELLDDANKAGYETLFEPPELAGDKAYVGQAMAWACDTLKRQGSTPTYIQLLQATSPFITPHTIQAAAAMIIERDADMIVGVTLASDPTAFCKPIPEDFSLKDWYPAEFRGKTRQAFPNAYHLNGYIYLARTEVWAEQKDWWTTKIYGYVCDTHDNVDINTEEDFEYAEYQLERNLSRKRSLLRFIRKMFFYN